MITDQSITYTNTLQVDNKKNEFTNYINNYTEYYCREIKYILFSLKHHTHKWLTAYTRHMPATGSFNVTRTSAIQTQTGIAVVRFLLAVDFRKRIYYPDCCRFYYYFMTMWWCNLFWYTICFIRSLEISTYTSIFNNNN